MSPQPVPSTGDKVIACIDDSRYAESVCDYAGWSAQRMAAPLSLLHVLDEIDHTPMQNLSGNLGFGAQESLLEELADLDARRAKIAMEHGKNMLQSAREHLQKRGIEAVETRQRHGDLVTALHELQPETRMLVVGKRGHDTASAHGHIGSHLENIIRTLHTPILIAQQTFQPPSQIMIAFDGSATMRKGIRRVANSPLFRDIPCHLVMVGANIDSHHAALAEADAVMKQAGFTTRTSLIPGEPTAALISYQQENQIDLMIMGAYGNSRIRHLIIGSTTTEMLCKTSISLMVLR